MHIQSRSFSTGDKYPRIPVEASPRPRCLDPATNFRLNRQRSYCSCITKRHALVSMSISCQQKRDFRCKFNTGHAAEEKFPEAYCCC